MQVLKADAGRTVFVLEVEEFVNEVVLIDDEFMRSNMEPTPSQPEPEEYI